MKPFGYWRDPACIISCALYALNRGWLKPHVASLFLRNHFNDLLLIPAALPLLLGLHRLLGLRTHDNPPTRTEILLHAVGWSLLFEWAGPRITPATTGDLWDVAAYLVGALIAGIWWHRRHNNPGIGRPHGL